MDLPDPQASQIRRRRRPAQSPAQSPSATHHRRVRKPVSCKPCREAKLRCDRLLPCSSCKRKGYHEACTYGDQGPPPSHPARNQDTPKNPTSRTPKTPVAPRPRPPNEPYTTSTLPNPPSPPRSSAPGSTPRDYAHYRWDSILRHPTMHMDSTAINRHNAFRVPSGLRFSFGFGSNVNTQELLAVLPAAHNCECLINRYFQHVSPLFHILHGPTFVKEYRAFVENPKCNSLSWLAVFFMILSMGVHVIDDEVLAELSAHNSEGFQTLSLSRKYRMAALEALSMDGFLVHHNLNTLEAVLLLIYSINHWEGVEYSWTLLGTALNMGISLHCNSDIDSPPVGLNCIDLERRRRCWTGILILHTNQVISYTDIKMPSLVVTQSHMPAIVDDSDIKEDKICTSNAKITQMTVMKFKLQLFRLSGRLSSHLSKSTALSNDVLRAFDSDIAAQQREWDETFLEDGYQSMLNPFSHACWCILQLYAHQLILLLHRPSRHSPHPNPGSSGSQTSRDLCIISGATLLDLHQRLYSLPILRFYRWYVYGVTSLYAVHGALALASCLLDECDETPDYSHYRAIFDSALQRFGELQSKSQVCAKAYPIIHHLQSMLQPGQFRWTQPAGSQISNSLDEWIDNYQWLNQATIDWDFWNDILDAGTFGSTRDRRLLLTQGYTKLLKQEK